MGLLFPFNWENAGIIPILPNHLYEFTEALFPFIFGIIANEDNQFGKIFLKKNELTLVNLDKNFIRRSKNTPKFSPKVF